MIENAGTAGTDAASAPSAGRATGAANRDVADVMAGVGGSRGWQVAYGVITVIAGMVAVVWPAVSAVTLAIVFAVQLFVLGIYRIVAAFAVPESSTGGRVLAVVIGIVSIVVAVLCLRSPLQTLIVLTLVLGAFWLVNGIVEIVDGIAGRGDSGRVWSIVGGLIGVIGGIVVLSSPILSAVALAWVLGFVLIGHGVVAIVAAFSRPAAAATT